MDYITRYYKNLSEDLQRRLNILETQLNEVKITKFVNNKAVTWDPSQESEPEPEAKKLRDTERKSVETSSTSPEQSETMAKEQDRRDFNKRWNERMNSSGYADKPSSGRKTEYNQDLPPEEQKSSEEMAAERQQNMNSRERIKREYMEKKQRERQEGR